MTKLNGRLRQGVLTGALALSVVVGGCGRDEPEAGVTPGAEVGTGGTAEAAVNIQDIVDNPASFVGRTVTVSGEVEEIYSPKGAFSITGGGAIAENQLLVLAKADKVPMVEENQNVRVRGAVRAYAVADLQRLETDIGWDFSPELETELERVKAVMIAETVTPIRQQ